MSENELPGGGSNMSAAPTGVAAINSTPEVSTPPLGRTKSTAETTIQSSKTKTSTLKDRIMDWISPSSLQRLRNDLSVLSERLEALKKRDARSIDWATSADNLLEQAKQAAKDGDVDRGWRCFNAADTFTLYGLSRVDPKELETRAMAIATEADEKVSSKWRKDCINALLKDENGKLPASVDVNHLVAAKAILDEFHDNVYRRLAIVKSRLALLTLAGTIFLLVWLFVLVPPIPATLSASNGSDRSDRPGSVVSSVPVTLTVSDGSNRPAFVVASVPMTLTVSGGSDGSAAVVPAVPVTLTVSDGSDGSPVVVASVLMTFTLSGRSDQNASANADAATFWRLVVLAGILGGLISAFTSAIGTDWRKSNIPAELSTQTITFARLVLAALSALAVTLFLSSGILSFGQLSHPLIIAVAVVSGFTDRLLLGAVERVAKPA